MTDLAITAADVAVVRMIEKFTAPAAEAILPGYAVRLTTDTGRVTGANGGSAGEARCAGIALTEATQEGDPVTVLRKGDVDLGDALGDLTYDDDVYLSDTDVTLADAHGTVTLIVGTVIPAWGATTADKLLRIDL